MGLPSIAGWFAHLNATTGINFTVFYDPFDRARFIHGFWVTLELSGVTILGSVLVGILGAWVQGAKSAWLRWLVAAYIQLFRNTPPLVQIYFFYFGLSALLPEVKNGLGFPHPLINGFEWACISLILFAGAFNVEIFRSGIEAIPSAMVEAAESLGFTRRQQLRLIILPQAVRRMIPPWMNLYAILTTSTTLASIVGVDDVVTRAGQVLAAEGSRPGLLAPIYAYVLLMFFLYTYPVAWATRRLERRAQAGAA